jgi:hypothetical protein
MSFEKALPLPQKAMVFTTGLTFQELLARSPVLAPALRSRLHEIRLSLDAQEFLVNYPDHLNCLVLLNEESPETLVVVPILVRIGETCPRLLMTLVCDNDDLSALAALTDEFDLAGALNEMDLPQLLIFDEEWNFQGQWGPHPKAAEPYLDDWFERHPQYEVLENDETPEAQTQYAVLLDKLTHEMRVWYNSSLNRACVGEVCVLLAGLLEEAATDEGETDS